MGYQSVVEPTLRKNIYNTIYTLIDANKLSGWTVLSAFPEEQAVFPCIVINPAKITLNQQGFKNGFHLVDVELVIELFSKSSGRKETMDLMRDKLQDIFVQNEDTLATYNILFPEGDMFIESESTNVIYDGQKLNLASVAVQLEVK